MGTWLFLGKGFDDLANRSNESFFVLLQFASANVREMRNKGGYLASLISKVWLFCCLSKSCVRSRVIEGNFLVCLFIFSRPPKILGAVGRLPEKVRQGELRKMGLTVVEALLLKPTIWMATT